MSKIKFVKYGVISGDVISSTSLSEKDRDILDKNLKHLLVSLEERFGTYGRVIKGDYLECVVPTPGKSLQIALAIKSFIKAKSATMDNYIKDKNRIRQYQAHGIRLAIGYGDLSRFDPKEGIIDGEAIYFSGREISGETSYDKERIVIKKTLFFASNHERLNHTFSPLLALLDVLLSKATSRQCEVLYLKLMDHSEEQISTKLGIGQSAVNQHSTSVGWNAIEEAVQFFKAEIPK